MASRRRRRRLADLFGLGFIALCFAGIGLMAREDRERLSPRELLDGGIAALGAAAVCAAFVLAHLPHRPGQSTFGSAVQLAYPIGFVVLVLIVVGAATVASKRSRAAWLTLTAAFVLVALASALAAAAGPSNLEAIKIVILAAWPAATLLVAASMWADPGVPDPLAARKGTVVWIPALACAAAIAVLFAGDAHAGRPCGDRTRDGCARPRHAAGIQRTAPGDRGARANREEPAGERSRVPAGR